MCTLLGTRSRTWFFLQVDYQDSEQFYHHADPWFEFTVATSWARVYLLHMHEPHH